MHIKNVFIYILNVQNATKKYILINSAYGKIFEFVIRIFTIESLLGLYFLDIFFLIKCVK